MKALVVGASGFLGRCLFRTLSTNGCDVIGTYASRPTPYLQPLDVRDAASAHALVLNEKPDVLFLTVDVPTRKRVSLSWNDLDDHRFMVDGAQVLSEAANEVGALVVAFSTTDVYSTAGVHSEDEPVSPTSPHGRLKADTEAAIRATARRHLIIRSDALFGWDRAADDLVQQVHQAGSGDGAATFSADRLIQPTLVDYISEATLRLIQSDANGVLHLTGADRVSELDFARLLGRILMVDTKLIDANDVRETNPISPALDLTRVTGVLGTEPMGLDEATKRLRRQWRADTYTGIAHASVSDEAEGVRQQIFGLVEKYYELVHVPKPFVPFESRINYSGRYFDAREMVSLADSMLDFWLTLGPYGDLFEAKMKRVLGSRDFALVNSGSSANLTAITTLASPLVEGHLQPGDEVITPAVTFPTTLAPVLQNGLVPVFVDCEIGTYNVDPTAIEHAISPRTRALVIPHTLGNPGDLEALTDIAARHHLWFVEDTCDALGATFDGRPVGTFGDLGTLSFYPAHHITMGEGGGVIINRANLSRAVRAVRDWGRDCWCAPGESNTCAKRFGWCLGGLPDGYDHKYIYSTIGFNLKPTDMQAAIGAAQLEKLPMFVERRRHNFSRLYAGLESLQDHLILPTWHPKANPSWFGFPITVRESGRRAALIQWLETANIETRLVFAGNILRQPGYQSIPHRVAGSLENSDRTMRDTLFVGVYPGITDEMVDFMISRFVSFFNR